MKSLHLRWNTMYPYILWFYIIVNTTFYVFSNKIDNLLQIICLFYFLFVAAIIVYKTKVVGIPYNLLLSFFFIVLGIIPDVLNGRYIGLRVSLMYAVPLVVFLEYSGRFYTACPVMETVDSGMMETAIPEMQNQ